MSRCCRNFGIAGSEIFITASVKICSVSHVFARNRRANGETVVSSPVHHHPLHFSTVQTDRMAETDVDNELLDYEEDEEPQVASESAVPASKKEVKGSYVSIHSSGFRDFLLKPELLRAIVDCGFEHPSEGKDACARAVFV